MLNKKKKLYPFPKNNKLNKSYNNTIHNEDNSSNIRVNKFISEKGICSRREADKLIEQGRVTINGITAETGSKISKGDIVKLDNKILTEDEEHVYILLNKPVGITCTTDKKDKDNISDFMNYPKRIFPVGRLDKDSEGLILLTNDGDIVNKILRSGNNHEKEYLVSVDKTISEEFIRDMSKEVKILGTMTKPCRVYMEGKNKFRIILTQGLNRQIRRMCSVFGYSVTKLKRIRIMNLKLGNLQIGSWRYLTKNELNALNLLICDSIKTEEASH